MSTVRAFVAIELPPSVRSQLGALIDRLARRAPAGAVRWVRPEAIHLTLKFLGQVPEARLGPLAQALADAARGRPAFSVRLAGLGVFPNPERPRVLWLGVEDPGGPLARLQRDLEGALAALGSPREQRGFSPHLTLGRVRREASARQAAQAGEALQQAGAVDLGELRVVEIVLFRSELRPSGAVYHRLAASPLEPQA